MICFLVMFIIKHNHTAIADYNLYMNNETNNTIAEQINENKVEPINPLSVGTTAVKSSHNANDKSNSNYLVEDNKLETEQDSPIDDFSHLDYVESTSNSNNEEINHSKDNNTTINDEHSKKQTDNKNLIQNDKEVATNNNIQESLNENTPADDEVEDMQNSEIDENIQEDKIKYQDPFELVAKMKAGINIGNALDAYGNKYYEDITMYETQWHNPVITESLMKYIKEIGFNTVRIPVTWDVHLLEDGTIDNRWLERVKQVVDYAYKYNLYVIINVHHDKWYNTEYSNLYNALKMTETVWAQIATYFKDYDCNLIFEGFNEPRIMCGDNDIEFGVGNEEAYDVINYLNSKFIEVVRNTGGNNNVRCLMISAYCANGDKKVLDTLHIPDDKNIILSCHFYAPHKFTQEGYSQSTWSLSDYDSRSNMDYKLNSMYKFSIYNKIPVVITEFGATDKNNIYYREAWCEYVVNKFKEYGMSYIWWDNNCYEDTFGLYGIIDREKLAVKFPTIVKILTGK